MSQDVLVVAEHLQGALGDITFEMLGQAKSLAGLLVSYMGHCAGI